MRMRLALALFCLLFLPQPAAAKDVLAGPLTGQVLAVLDGDTVTRAAAYLDRAGH